MECYNSDFWCSRKAVNSYRQIYQMSVYRYSQNFETNSQFIATVTNIVISKEFDTRRHRKRLQLQSRQLYFRCKQKLLKSQLRGRSWPILYIIVFLGVVWITVLVFCQFKQKIGKKSPFFFINQLIFYP